MNPDRSNGRAGLPRPPLKKAGLVCQTCFRNTSGSDPKKGFILKDKKKARHLPGFYVIDLISDVQEPVPNEQGISRDWTS